MEDLVLVCNASLINGKYVSVHENRDYLMHPYMIGYVIFVGKMLKESLGGRLWMQLEKNIHRLSPIWVVQEMNVSLTLSNIDVVVEVRNADNFKQLSHI